MKLIAVDARSATILGGQLTALMSGVLGGIGEVLFNLKEVPRCSEGWGDDG